MLSGIIPTITRPAYMPSGLAFSTDVNNRKDRYQATMNNMGMERGRMRSQTTSLPARQWPRSGNEGPYDGDSDSADHFSYFVLDRLEARLDDVRAASTQCRAVEHCDPLWSPCMMPYFPDICGPQQTFTFTWTGGEDIPISAAVSRPGQRRGM